MAWQHSHRVGISASYSGIGWYLNSLWPGFFSNFTFCCWSQYQPAQIVGTEPTYTPSYQQEPIDLQIKYQIKTHNYKKILLIKIKNIPEKPFTESRFLHFNVLLQSWFQNQKIKKSLKWKTPPTLVLFHQVNLIMSRKWSPIAHGYTLEWYTDGWTPGYAGTQGIQLQIYSWGFPQQKGKKRCTHFQLQHPYYQYRIGKILPGPAWLLKCSPTHDPYK